MHTGKVTVGAASARLSYSQMVAPHLRGRMRELSALTVDQAQRGTGCATALLKSVCADADKAGVLLLVVVEPFGDAPLSVEQLRDWYARHGFKVIQEAPAVVMARAAQRVLNG